LPPETKSPDKVSKEQYIHHDNVTQISIFPQGVATEAVRGETAPGSSEIGVSIKESLDHILKNGEVWASFINPAQSQENWRDWGFIWAAQKVSDPSFGCVRQGVEISVEECDPFFGDQFTRSGIIDNEFNEIKMRMLQSFKFI